VKNEISAKLVEKYRQRSTSDENMDCLPTEPQSRRKSLTELDLEHMERLGAIKYKRKRRRPLGLIAKAPGHRNHSINAAEATSAEARSSEETHSESDESMAPQFIPVGDAIVSVSSDEEESSDESDGEIDAADEIRIE